MFESLDAAPEKEPTDDPVTAAEALGVYGLVLLLAFGSAAVFISLGDRPYGVQGAILFSYSGAIFIWTFFRTRGIKTKHNISAPYVLKQLPRLLLIHLAYLVAIFFLETWALAFHLSKPGWWLIGMTIGVSQVIISRGILGHAKKEFGQLVANGSMILAISRSPFPIEYTQAYGRAC